MNNIVDRIYLDIQKVNRELIINENHEVCIYVTHEVLSEIEELKNNLFHYEKTPNGVKYFLFGLNLFTFNNGYNDNEYQITVRLL